MTTSLGWGWVTRTVPNMERVYALEQARLNVWGNGGRMEDAFAGSGQVACIGKSGIFDAAHSSIIARWIAARICEECPIQATCSTAAEDGQEYGVWGGRFSADGRSWSDVKALRQNEVMTSLLTAINPKDRQPLRGHRMVHVANKVAPGIWDLFTDEQGKLTHRTQDQCIIRQARRVPLPDGTIGSERLYILTTILCLQMDEGRGSIHTTCSTRDCVSPWHLRWRRGPLSLARSIALGLYATSIRGWTVERATEITGMQSRDLTLISSLAEMFSAAGAKIPYPALGEITSGFQVITGREPTTAEMSGLIRLCSAADDLDCDTVADLVEAGRSEF